MLKIENIKCGYEQQLILKGISADISEDKVVGIIGPNGSGKTTLLRAITRIVPLSSGRIIYRGKDIRSFSQRELARKIAVVSNDFDLRFDITVKDFVALGRTPHQEAFQFFETEKDNEIVLKALAQTEMTDYKKQSMNKLSAGQRQLAVIAKALAQEPELLLLDEPIVHLDIAYQVYILDLLKKLNKKHSLSLLIVLHQLNMASEYCDQLILLDDGKVNKKGTVKDVLQEDVLKKVYKTAVHVGENPVSKNPYVFTCPK